VNQFNSLRLGSIEDDNFAIDCSALQIGYRTASLSCVADASFEGSFGTPSPAPVTEPATLWLFGLGLAGVVGFRRRRSGA